MGSTDRKTYTLQFSADYLDKYYSCLVDIAPYLSQDEKKAMIDENTLRVKNKLACDIYRDLTK